MEGDFRSSQWDAATAKTSLLSSQDGQPTNHSKTRADACDWWSAGHMTKDIAAREADNPNNTHSSTFARSQSRQGQMQKGVPESREAKARHRGVMESEVRGHNHNPNESGIAVCSSTQILSFQPLWPVRNINPCQYLLCPLFYLCTGNLTFLSYLLRYVFIPGLEMLSFHSDALSLLGSNMTNSEPLWLCLCWS